ncbi:MAG: hypothetical protein LQ341_007240, partial [Variospora aurantia]
MSDHHLSFIHVESSSHSNGSSNGAYYSTSLKDPVQDPFSVGWKVGRSISINRTPSKGVNILLIRPGQNPRNVAPVHARIRLHPQSGVLVLHGMQDDQPVDYVDPDSGELVHLRSHDSRVMYAKINVFSVGNLHYRLVFPTFTGQQYSGFMLQRNLMMQTYGLNAIDSSIPSPRNALYKI